MLILDFILLKTKEELKENIIHLEEKQKINKKYQKSINIKILITNLNFDIFANYLMFINPIYYINWCLR